MVIFGGFVGLVVGFAVIGAPLAAALALWIGVSIIFPVAGPVVGIPVAALLVVHFVIVAVLYITGGVAQTITRVTNPGVQGPQNLLEQFCRGCLIGLNAITNFSLLAVLLTAPLITAVIAIPFATFIGLLNFLAVFENFSLDATYASWLGWFSFAMPLSWPMTLLGAIWWLINFFFFLGGVPTTFFMDFPTGGVILQGSVVNFFAGRGYNLGNFSFLAPDTTFGALSGGTASAEGVLLHEQGHLLNVAAMGVWFHLMNGIDDWLRIGGLLGGVEPEAYGEMLAESHERSSSRPWVTFWAPYVGPSAAGAANAPPNGDITLTPGNITIGLAPFPVFLLAQALPAGQTFQADGSAMTDPDSYALGSLPPFPGAPPVIFSWTLPPNGFVSIDATSGPIVNVTTALGGDAPDLVIVASDGVDARGASVSFAVVEARPNGPYQGLINQDIALDPSGSTAGIFGKLPSEAEAGEPVLNLLWQITGQPVGSTPEVSNPTAENATFRSDIPGRYDLTLTVSAAGVAHTAATTVDLT